MKTIIFLTSLLGFSMVCAGCGSNFSPDCNPYAQCYDESSNDSGFSSENSSAEGAQTVTDGPLTEVMQEEIETAISQDSLRYEFKDSVDWTFFNIPYMDEVLKSSGKYTFDDLRKAVSKNESLEEYADYFYDFIDGLEKEYPDLSLTIFYYNLSHTTLHAVDDETMDFVKGDGTLGTFNAKDLEFYINTDAQSEGTDFDYVIYHEIGHMVNNYQEHKKGRNCEFHFAPDNCYGYLLQEGLNCMFAEDVTKVTIEYPNYQSARNTLNVLMDACGLTIEDMMNNTVEYLMDYCAPAFSREPDISDIDFMNAIENRSSLMGEDSEADIDSECAAIYVITSRMYFMSHVREDAAKDELEAIYANYYAAMTENQRSPRSFSWDFSPAVETFYEVLDEYHVPAENRPDRSSLTSSFEVNTF